MAETARTIKVQKFDTKVWRISGNDLIGSETDVLAIEEPLEIRLGFAQNGKFQHQPISITMRTPGDDFELAVGFLFTEGVLQTKSQIQTIKHCGKFPNNRNTVRVDLQPNVEIDLKGLDRNSYMTSSCGVCGKGSLEALATGAKAIAQTDLPKVSAKTIHRLPERLRGSQPVFDDTGGLHASAIFDSEGNMIGLREDVGRHNALDKVIGALFLENKLPLSDKILFLSGRASFELIQKAAMAGIPIVCTVGAPSSLAVDAAKEFNITLLGFVRDNRFNVYAGMRRGRFGPEQ
jgi:FdhD protein